LIIRAKVLGLGDGDTTTAIRVGVLAADQRPRDKQLPVERIRLGDVDIKGFLPQVAGRDGLEEHTLDLRPISPRSPTQKRMPLQVASQPDAGGDHHVVHRPAGSEPFSRRACEIVDTHDCLSNSAS
jgi:hypothetical protein